MTRAQWKKRITKAMEGAGTYRESFDDAIDTLAGMLERRDALEKEYNESGEPMIVEHTNKAGATNYEQNPAIRLLNDMNRDALTYWRDLGLTPKGLKAISDMVPSDDKVDPLDALIDQLGR